MKVAIFSAKSYDRASLVAANSAHNHELKSFPNVVVTAHQAFFTQNALQAIAETTLANITKFEQGQILSNQVKDTPS